MKVSKIFHDGNATYVYDENGKPIENLTSVKFGIVAGELPTVELTTLTHFPQQIEFAEPVEATIVEEDPITVYVVEEVSDDISSEVLGVFLSREVAEKQYPEHWITEHFLNRTARTIVEDSPNGQ